MIFSKEVKGEITGQARHLIGKIFIPAEKDGVVDSFIMYNDGYTPVEFQVEQTYYDIMPFIYPVGPGLMKTIFQKSNDRLPWRAPMLSEFYIYGTPFKYKEPFEVGFWLCWRKEIE